MKSREVRRVAERNERREQYLRNRFIQPISTITSWDATALDLASAYVSLLHAESESTLEDMVRLVIENARIKTQKYRASTVLLNCVIYFRHEVDRCIPGLGLIPERSALERDRTLLLEAWSKFGAERFFERMIEDNHGTGQQYVERLLHPLGIVVSRKGFKRAASYGVKQVAQLQPITTTDLQEFVTMRGRAVHASNVNFGRLVATDTPSQIAGKGEAVTRFLHSVALTMARSAW